MDLYKCYNIYILNMLGILLIGIVGVQANLGLNQEKSDLSVGMQYRGYHAIPASIDDETGEIPPIYNKRFLSSFPLQQLILSTQIGYLHENYCNEQCQTAAFTYYTLGFGIENSGDEDVMGVSFKFDIQYPQFDAFKLQIVKAEYKIYAYEEWQPENVPVVVVDGTHRQTQIASADPTRSSIEFTETTYNDGWQVATVDIGTIEAKKTFVLYFTVERSNLEGSSEIKQTHFQIAYLYSIDQVDDLLTQPQQVRHVLLYRDIVIGEKPQGDTYYQESEEDDDDEDDDDDGTVLALMIVFIIIVTIVVCAILGWAWWKRNKTKGFETGQGVGEPTPNYDNPNVQYPKYEDSNEIPNHA